MPEADEEKPDEKPPRPPPPPSQIGRELMDLDLDLDAAWPFDPAAFLSGSPPPGFFLSASSPPTAAQMLSQLSQFPPPLSPLCLFDGRAAELPDALSEFSKFAPDPGTSAAVDDVLVGDGRKVRPLVTAAVEDASDISCVIKEKMTQALRQFKESTDQHVLVQVWAPVKNGDRYVLTTSGQPFVLDPHSTSLFHYRTVSLMYLFSADGNTDGDLGLPGRVFRKKLPEWTPDVQYYSSREYPRLTHALNYNVRGTLALPVFEPSCQACVGVVELIMTSPKINYAHEVDKVCKALEAVNLKSSEILDHPTVQICNEGRQAALAEILEILSVVCETHKLPLAQTWVPCRHGSVLAYGGGSKKSCSSFDGSCMGQICMSTTDAAFYVVDPHMWRFRDACAEHHLQKGQGVAGMAFSLCRPCFSSDITQFCKTQYPLVHYARMFGLASCLAICLQSSHTGNDDYVLEFFLPTNCKSDREQQALLETISTTIRQCLHSLNVIFKSENQDDVFHEIFHVTPNENGDVESTNIHNQISETRDVASSEVKGPQVLASSQHDKISSQNLFEHVLTKSADKNEKTLMEESQVPTNVPCTKNVKSLKTHERRRGKAEKTISLEVLQQYFAGSLKDAAKSLGVCPTTMKRICRQHGISRWPSRKINKVNRSLSKLKRVIESVHGAEGAFSLTSLTTCPLPVAVGSHGWPNSLDDSQQNQLSGKHVDLFDERGNDPSAHTSPGDEPSGEPLCQQVLPDQSNLKDSHGLQTSSSGEESTATPASQGSCQGSPPSGNNLEIPSSSPITEQAVNINGSLVVTFQLGESANPSSADQQRCDVNETAMDLPLGGMLIEDAGSSKDLKNLCLSSGEACLDKQAIFFGNGSSRNEPLQDLRTVTIKASYREDIIRFRMQCNAGILVLKEEVAKRLKLDVGTFDIKYLDDDGEWVLLACDADLEECLEVSRLSGGHVIRLSVHDLLVILGSSCESSGE